MSGVLHGLMASIGVTIRAPNVSAAGAQPGTSFAGLSWDNDGTIDKTEDLTTTNDFDDWMLPTNGDNAANYEIKFEQSAGSGLDVASDPLSTWLALSTARNLQLTNPSAPSGISANGTYIIRSAASLAQLANGTWALSATAL